PIDASALSRPSFSMIALLKHSPWLLLTGAVALLAGGVRLDAAESAVTHPRWQEVAPGVWKAQVGKPEDLTLLSAAGGQPATAALRAMPAAKFPLSEDEIEAKQWGWKTALRFPLALGEDIYGLGVDFSAVRRTGTIFQLHVDHWGKIPG